MAVKYKYPNEEEQIINGDSYEINFYKTNIGNYYQAVGSIYYEKVQQKILFISPVIRTNQATIINERDSNWLISSNANTDDANNVWFSLPIIADYEFFPQGRRSNPRPNSKDIEQALNLLPNADPPPGYVSLNLAHRLGGGRYFTRIISNARSIGGSFAKHHLFTTSSDPQILYYHPCEYTPQYTLLIYKDNLLTFNKTKIVPPEYVEIFEGKECPSNTCPVKCGDNICCYRSDGIATESFLFSESIY